MKARADQLLTQIFSATNLFAPIDIMATALQEVAPVYTAQFTFEIPATGKVQLELEMNKPGAEGLYERSNSVWTRVKDRAENVNPMEIFVVRLQGYVNLFMPWRGKLFKVQLCNFVSSISLTLCTGASPGPSRPLPRTSLTRLASVRP